MCVNISRVFDAAQEIEDAQEDVAFIQECDKLLREIMRRIVERLRDGQEYRQGVAKIKITKGWDVENLPGVLATLTTQLKTITRRLDATEKAIVISTGRHDSADDRHTEQVCTLVIK